MAIIEKKYIEIGNRLKLLRGQLSQKDMAKRIKVSYRAYSRYETGERPPTEPVLANIAQEFDISFDWILKGEKIIKENRSIVEVAEEKLQYSDSGFVFIPQVTGKISAGGGLAPDNTVEITIGFKKDWIGRKGDPRQMSLIRVSGDSMEDTLFSGDLVLIDHNRTRVDPQGGIYAITVGDDIMLKRLHLLYPLQKVRIISDNKQYDPLEVSMGDLIINGKVIWFARELER